MRIRADIFPAIVEFDDSERAPVSKARVVVTLDHIYVFIDGQPNPTIVFDGSLDTYSPPVPSTRMASSSTTKRDRAAQFTTEDGSGFFYRMSSCGCGSRLKNTQLSTLFPETDNNITQVVSSNDS